MNKFALLVAASAIVVASPALAQGYPNPHNPHVQTGGNGNGNNGCGNGNSGNSGQGCDHTPTTGGGTGNGGNGGNGGAGGNGGTGFAVGVGVGIGSASSTATSTSTSGAVSNSVSTGGNSVSTATGGTSVSSALGGNASATGGNATGGNASNANNSNNSSQVTVQGDTYVQRRIPVSTAYSPALTSGLDTCLGSASAGVSTGVFGISLGGTKKDEVCQLIKLGREAAAMQMPDVQCRILSRDRRFAEALAASNRTCQLPPAPEPQPVIIVNPPQPTEERG